LREAQPPSGGCVLKHLFGLQLINEPSTAAFGRLCVETMTDLLRAYLYTNSRLRAAVC